MLATGGVILTSAGVLMISRSLELVKPIEFTHMKIGTGDISSLDSARALTDLVASYMTINMSSIVRNENTVRIRGSFTNESFSSEVTIKEIGVFAKIGTEQSVLFGYVNDGQGEIIPPGNSGNVISRTRDLYVGVTSEAEAVITIDKSLVYPTIEDLEEGLNQKENKFNKNSGFNKNKSDATNLDDSETLATSKAICMATEKTEEALRTKEPTITKKTGFNLDKTDLTENDSNKLFTAKGALNLFDTLTTNITNAINSAKEILGIDIAKKLDKGIYTGDAQSLKIAIDGKEPTIAKKTGFNLDKTDLTENDSNKLFTAKGALNLFDTLTTNITNAINSAKEILGIDIAKKLDKGIYTGDAQSLKTAIDGKEATFNKNTAFNKNFGVVTGEVLEGSKMAEVLGLEYGGILNNTSAKTSGKGYYDTTNKKIYKCTANNSLNYADAGYFIELSNNDLLDKLQNLFSKGSNINGSWTKNMITGEIIQRGDSGTYSNRQIKTITLPTSFSDTNYIVIVVNMNTTADNFYAYQPHAKTLSNFKIRCQDSAGSSNGAVCWLAIGY